MNAPVLLTGASGLLGTWLRRTAPDPGGLVAVVHQRSVPGIRSVRADLRDPAAVTAAVAEVAPRVVVHAAYAKDRSSIVDATGHVVAAAHEAGARVVFVSSDAVFSGDGRVRDETSPPDPTWDYGRWKAAAEAEVLALGDGGAVVRLPLLVSLDPPDPGVRQLLEAHRSGRPSVWYVDELRQPVWAGEAASALWRIVDRPDGSGCWHLVGAERVSRWQLAVRLVEHLGLPEGVIAPATQPAGEGRPRALLLGDARARERLGWLPTPI